MSEERLALQAAQQRRLYSGSNENPRSPVITSGTSICTLSGSFHQELEPCLSGQVCGQVERKRCSCDDRDCGASPCPAILVEAEPGSLCDGSFKGWALVFDTSDGPEDMAISGVLPTQLGLLVGLTSLDFDGQPNRFLIQPVWMRGATLSGTLPTQLGSLTELVHLSIDNIDDLSGTLPTQLGSRGLSELHVVLVSHGKVSGTLPTQLTLTEVMSLGLSMSGLSGPLPSEIGGMGLTTFGVTSSAISGTLPSELGRLDKIYTLTLGPEHFGGLVDKRDCATCVLPLSGTMPSQLGGMSSMVGLTLVASEMSGVLPTQLGTLDPGLFSCQLQGHRLSGTVPSQLAKQSRLRTLQLEDNRLSGTIPALPPMLDQCVLDGTNAFACPLPKGMEDECSVGCAWPAPPALPSPPASPPPVPPSLTAEGGGPDPSDSGILPPSPGDQSHASRLSAGSLAGVVVVILLVLCTLFIARARRRRGRPGWTNASSLASSTNSMPLVPLIKPLIKPLVCEPPGDSTSQTDLGAGNSSDPQQPGAPAVRRARRQARLQQQGGGGFTSSFQTMLSGSQFKGFVPVYVLGCGSSGVAVLMHNGERYVVTKQIFVEKMRKSELAMVQGEVLALRELSRRSKHVVQYLDCFFHVGVLCLVMEYAAAGTLEHLIEAQVEAKTALRTIAVHVWLYQLASALQIVHEANILHRDIKTSNILLTAAGDIKLADFGLAKRIDEGANMSLMAETHCGTLIYLAPERARGERYSKASDVWGVGVVLYEMLTLRYPFDDSKVQGDMGALIQCLKAGKVASEPLAASDHPSELTALASPAHLFHVDPLQRMTMPALMEHLRTHAGASGLTQAQVWGHDDCRAAVACAVDEFAALHRDQPKATSRSDTGADQTEEAPAVSVLLQRVAIETVDEVCGPPRSNEERASLLSDGETMARHSPTETPTPPSTATSGSSSNDEESPAVSAQLQP